MDFIPYLENSARCIIQLNIVDLILLNPSTTEAYKWVFTDTDGYAKCRQFKPLLFNQIAKNLLSNMSTTLANSPEHRRIVCRMLNI